MSNEINITEEEAALIDRYLHRQLSAQEQVAFEERLAGDGRWREKVNELRLLSTAIQENFLEQKLDDFHDQLDKASNKPRIIKINPMKRLAVAASVFVIIGAVSWLLFFQKTAQEKLYATYYSPDPGLPTLMGVSDNYEFEKAMVDYKTGDYPEAISTWKQLLNTNPGNDTLLYFLGSAYLANEETKEAISFFEKAAAVPGSVFMRDALWYKALALLKEGSEAEAVRLLKATDHPDKGALLRKLEE